MSFCRVSQWFEDKFQEVDNEEQQLRKLHAVVDSLVNHRKGEPRLTCLCPVLVYNLLVSTEETVSSLQLLESSGVKQAD